MHRVSCVMLGRDPTAATPPELLDLTRKDGCGGRSQHPRSQMMPARSLHGHGPRIIMQGGRVHRHVESKVAYHEGHVVNGLCRAGLLAVHMKRRPDRADRALGHLCKACVLQGLHLHGDKLAEVLWGVGALVSLVEAGRHEGEETPGHVAEGKGGRYIGFCRARLSRGLSKEGVHMNHVTTHTFMTVQYIGHAP